MYQALYRKWRPQTFDEVVGQPQVTQTLKRQVAAGRLSHAYLFTGTRGTGKTSCAKILARAVNCENPQDGNPCNTCPACLGILNDSILDVMEIDAASNNGVDDIRALRDEAVFSPSTVRKRVYILDEVHMLSTGASNALLKILEEPPEHLLFILATTELHKVRMTIRSRCQQFSFQRLLPEQIAQRLAYVAQQEGISLSPEGGAMLAQLAGGAMRDALSLLDQCAGGGRAVSEQTVLDVLGLAGDRETERLLEQIAGQDADGVLESMDRLYAAGKEPGAILGELSALVRELLLRAVAPRGGAALLRGGYSEESLRRSLALLSPARLSQMLKCLQETAQQLPRSANRRTDAELCLLTLCRPELDESPAGLSARIARLERLLASAPVPTQAAQPQRNAPVREAARREEPPSARQDSPAPERESTRPARFSAPSPEQEAPLPTDFDAPPPEREVPLPMDFDAPPPEREAPMPMDLDAPPPEREAPPTDFGAPPSGRSAPSERFAAPNPAQTAPSPAAGPEAAAPQSAPVSVGIWPLLLEDLQGQIPPFFAPYFRPERCEVTGSVRGDVLSLWTETIFTQKLLKKPQLTALIGRVAQARLGRPVRVEWRVGTPPPADPAPAPAERAAQPPAAVPAQTPAEQDKAFEELLSSMKGLENFIVE